MSRAMIKAIETIYNGYRFRSRLEARWAVFFDTLGIEYQYEVEGFDLGNAGWYLPDFWLPTQKLWLEIKPNIYDSLDGLWVDHPVFDLYASQTDDRVYFGSVDFKVVVGEPWIDTDSHYFRSGFNFGSIPDPDAYRYVICQNFDTNYFWCECIKCGAINAQFQGRANRNCKCFDTDDGNNACSPRLISAYNAARQAQFEHGETPKVD